MPAAAQPSVAVVGAVVFKKCFSDHCRRVDFADLKLRRIIFFCRSAKAFTGRSAAPELSYSQVEILGYAFDQLECDRAAAAVIGDLQGAIAKGVYPARIATTVERDTFERRGFEYLCRQIAGAQR